MILAHTRENWPVVKEKNIKIEPRIYITIYPHASKVLFLALSVTLVLSFFLFVYQISRETLNGFAPNSQ